MAVKITASTTSPTFWGSTSSNTSVTSRLRGRSRATCLTPPPREAASSPAPRRMMRRAWRRSFAATGLRVFRRPLAAEEVATYRKVYERARQLGEDHNASLEQVLRALLSSVEFLYRIETDPNPASAAAHPVTAYELASRLSYFLWSSAPDDPLLLGRGRRNNRSMRTLLQAIVDRMLGDPKVERFIQNFVGQWLGARRVSAHAVTPELFPEWSPALANAMAEEIYRYFSEFLRDDRSWLEFSESRRQLRRRRSGAALRHEPARARDGPGRSEERRARGVPRARGLPRAELVRVPHRADAARALDPDQPAVLAAARSAARCSDPRHARVGSTRPSRTCASGWRSTGSIRTAGAATPRWIRTVSRSRTSTRSASTARLTGTAHRSTPRPSLLDGTRFEGLERAGGRVDGAAQVHEMRDREALRLRARPRSGARPTNRISRGLTRTGGSRHRPASSDHRRWSGRSFPPTPPG